MGTREDQQEQLKRLVQDKMLEWKCKVENPPRKKTPVRLTTPSISGRQGEHNHLNSSTSKLFEKLPKIFAFENSTGGAGAPRRSPSGRLQTDLRGHPEIRFHQRDNTIFERSMRYQLDKEQIRRYKEELDQQLAEKMSIRVPSKPNENCTDLATLMSNRSGNVIKRWESLPKLTSTDITRNYVNSPRTPDADEYKKGLESQLESKRRFQEQQTKQEKYLNSLHFNAFDNFWGKAAPRPKKKENLFKLLHSTR